MKAITMWANLYQGAQSGMVIIGGNMLHTTREKAEAAKRPSIAGLLHIGVAPVPVPVREHAMMPTDGSDWFDDICKGMVR